MTARVPAEVFPPGEFIKEELEARGWTQSDLAEILGRPPRLVSEIISAKRAITPETAKGLADAFGTDPQFWLNLESSYQLARIRTRDDTVARRARLFSRVPLKEMLRRHWITPTSDLTRLERQVCEFFGIKSLDDEPAFPVFAARTATPYSELTISQRTWLFRARHLAELVKVKHSFSDERLKQALVDLRGLLRTPEQTRDVPHILAEAGIRFLVLEPLPQSRIDGACFWLDDKAPVIVVSLRYDRIDWFWHTVAHEVGHVRNRDVVNVDTDLMEERARLPEDARPLFEREVDAFATDLLVPHKELIGFIARVRPLYSKQKIIGFAGRLGVHPGIIVGQLQFRGEIPWGHSREMLARVRQFVTETALTDGWGGVITAAF
jgi:HTH-type transcriptional regulator / antitoxin HigA